MTNPRLTGENVRTLRRMRADLDPKAGPLSALKAEALDAVLASFNPEPAPTRCNMGMGCNEAGVCYASAMGEPERCAVPPAEKTDLATLARAAVAAVEHFIKSEERETWTSRRKHAMTAGERIAAGVTYREAMNKLKEALEKEPK